MRSPPGSIPRGARTLLSASFAPKHPRPPPSSTPLRIGTMRPTLPPLLTSPSALEGRKPLAGGAARHEREPPVVEEQTIPPGVRPGGARETLVRPITPPSAPIRPLAPPRGAWGQCALPSPVRPPGSIPRGARTLLSASSAPKHPRPPPSSTPRRMGTMRPTFPPSAPWPHPEAHWDNAPYLSLPPKEIPPQTVPRAGRDDHARNRTAAALSVRRRCVRCVCAGSAGVRL